jgi:hypothetical protein
MRLLSLLSIAVLLNSVAAVSGQSQTTNTAPLRGGTPFDFANLPPLPPTGFYAWCETPRGFCKVKGNAPIAPASVCHCADFTGKTT